jgi:hypothetical protein
VKNVWRNVCLQEVIIECTVYRQVAKLTDISSTFMVVPPYVHVRLSM